MQFYIFVIIFWLFFTDFQVQLSEKKLWKFMNRNAVSFFAEICGFNDNLDSCIY